MPEIYPTRTNSEIEKELIDVCVCGHIHAMHNGYRYDSIDKESCHSCTCPEYRFEQKLTHKQSIDLAVSLLQKNRRSGFST